MVAEAIEPGITLIEEQEVTPERAASHLGSGSLQVYATPAMLAFIEGTCRKLIEPRLPAGQTTVGVQVHLRHLAPTPVGGRVRARAEVIEVEGGTMQFRVEVDDETERVGEAVHTRAVIDVERFLRRVQAKAERQS